jgi:hypothetical protein
LPTFSPNHCCVSIIVSRSFMPPRDLSAGWACDEVSCGCNKWAQAHSDWSSCAASGCTGKCCSQPPSCQGPLSSPLAGQRPHPILSHHPSAHSCVSSPYKGLSRVELRSTLVQCDLGLNYLLTTSFQIRVHAQVWS